MTTTRDPFDLLVALAPARPADLAGLARARMRVDAAMATGRPTGLQRAVRVQVRSRRVVRVAVVAVVAGLLSIAAPQIDLGSRHAKDAAPRAWGLAPAAAQAAGCQDVLAAVPGLFDPDLTVPRERWSALPAVSRVLYAFPGRTVTSGRVLESPASCDALPAAVLYDAVGQRGITVYRNVEPVLRGAPAQLLDPVTVRGRPGQVLTPPAGSHYLTWVDATGIRWYAEASGLGAAELVHIMDTDLGPTGLVTVPDGYVAAPAVPPEPTGSVFRWSATYSDGTYLEVTTPVRSPVQTRFATNVEGALQLTTVGSWSAVYGADQGGMSLWWSTDQATFRLIVPGAGLAELQHLAAGLEPAAADDPRLVPGQG